MIGEGLSDNVENGILRGLVSVGDEVGGTLIGDIAGFVEIGRDYGCTGVCSVLGDVEKLDGRDFGSGCVDDEGGSSVRDAFEVGDEAMGAWLGGEFEICRGHSEGEFQMGCLVDKVVHH